MYMKANLVALALLTALISSSPARSQTRHVVSVPKGWSVVLYQTSKYRGSTKKLAESVPKMEPKWARAKSVIIVGQWELCTGANFTGECRQLRSSIADLQAYGFPGQVKSIRPVLPKKLRS
jgi:hypothetical protein